MRRYFPLLFLGAILGLIPFLVSTVENSTAVGHFETWDTDIGQEDAPLAVVSPSIELPDTERLWPVTVDDNRLPLTATTLVFRPPDLRVLSL